MGPAMGADKTGPRVVESRLKETGGVMTQPVTMRIFSDYV
jgi:hypothetical protein